MDMYNLCIYIYVCVYILTLTLHQSVSQLISPACLAKHALLSRAAWHSECRLRLRPLAMIVG